MGLDDHTLSPLDELFARSAFVIVDDWSEGPVVCAREVLRPVQTAAAKRGEHRYRRAINARRADLRHLSFDPYQSPPKRRSVMYVAS
jgi:hypothetical protein